MWSNWFTGVIDEWIVSVCTLQGKTFPVGLVNVISIAVFLYSFQEEIWVYILIGHLAPKAYKNGLLFIGNVIHLTSDLISFPYLSQKNTHSHLLFIFQDRIEFPVSQLLYWLHHHNMLNLRCQDLNVFGYITVDQSEDSVPFFKVTWIVMYYKKAGKTGFGSTL